MNALTAEFMLGYYCIMGFGVRKYDG